MGERRPFESPNLKSAREQPHIVNAKLNKELTAGRIAGPFLSAHFPNFSLFSLKHLSQKGSLNFV